ncbi:MAG: (2Fe-2S)-binding protein [Clostridiaceae bacterium]|nr:(2Fe-2S)-binding protein [Clostridiaceae bacterium]
MSNNEMKMGLKIEDYKKVRLAMSGGARTLDDIKKSTDIFIEDDEYAKNIEKVLKNACTCKKVSIEEVVKAVKNGADTLEKVREATGANTACMRCTDLIQNIIDNGR